MERISGAADAATRSFASFIEARCIAVLRTSRENVGPASKRGGAAPVHASRYNRGAEMSDPPAPVGTVLRHDPAREVPAEYDVFCEGCGYSLAGIAADRCPECGRAYDPAERPF